MLAFLLVVGTVFNQGLISSLATGTSGGVIAEWVYASELNLERWQNKVLTRWNEINLYDITRGINRFQGLLKILEEVNKKVSPVEGIEDLKKWVEQTPELSNEALKRALEKRESSILRKALCWSESVNQKIRQLEEREKRPFEGVKEALAYAHGFADIAIVSSANLKAVLEEWETYGLLEYTDIVLAQDTGSKAYYIQKLAGKGYDKEKILMTGDTIGDYEAAKLNGVFFYPILVRKESQSWRKFKEDAIPNLLEGTYKGIYQQGKLDGFLGNFANTQ